MSLKYQQLLLLPLQIIWIKVYKVVFSQQPKLSLTAVIVEGNQIVVLPTRHQFKHASLENLDTTRSHETIERNTFDEQMDRNAPTKNQNSIDAQAS